MNATLASLILASVFVLAASTSLPAADNDLGSATTASEGSSIDSASPQPGAPAPAGDISPASLAGSGESGDGNGSESAAAPPLDPGSKCNEFPEMCSAQ